MAAGAAAQPAPGAGAEAEQLFREGKTLMKAGKVAEACNAFETSHRLEPSVATLMNLADCREQNGQLASAWGLYLEVDRKTRGDSKFGALNEQAKARSARLEPRLSYLTVSVPTESQVDGLELIRNGAAFDEGLWNRAIPVDGGDYVITGKAPGHEAWSTTVKVPAEQGRITLDVPRFKEVSELMTEPAEVAEGPGGRFTGRRKIALAAGAAGVLAAGAGIALGLQAKGFEDDALALCPTTMCGANADEGNRLGDRAESRALYANVSYGVAAVAVGTAVVLWITGAPRRTTVAPRASTTSAGLDVMVSF